MNKTFQWFATHQTRITDVLCLLSILLLPWQARWIVAYRTIGGQPYEYGALSVYAGSAVVVLTLTMLWYRRLAHPRMMLAGRILFIWLLIISLFATDPVIGLSNLVLAIIAFAYFVIASSWKREKVIMAIIASATIQSLIAWAQFIDQRIFASTLLGVAEHLPWQLGQSVVMVHGQRVLRAYGVLPHPNMLAGLIAIALALVVYQFIRHERQDRTLHDSRMRLKGEILFLVLFSALLITFSRAGLMASVILAVGWFGYALATDRLFQIRGLGRLAVLGMVLFITFNSIAGGIWLSRLGIVFTSGEQQRLESLSTAERLVSFHEAYVVSHPRTIIMGLGLGNYIPTLARAIPNLPSYAYQPVHAVPVMAVLEIGAIGTALLAWFLSTLLPKGILKRGLKDILEHYPLSLMILLASIGLFDHYLWTSYFGQSLWWAVFGLAVSDVS